MDTVLELLAYLFYGLDAFIVWIAKGRRTPFKTELEEHKVRNSSIAALFLVIFIGLWIYIANYA